MSKPNRPDSGDDGFEIVDNVDDTPPKPNPRPSLPIAKRVSSTSPKKPKPVPVEEPGFEVIDDTEVSEITEEYEEYDERGRRPRKKASRVSKKSRDELKRADKEEREQRKEQTVIDWALPIFFMFFGLVLTLVSSAGYARKVPDAQLNVAAVMLVTVIFTAFIIPIAIVALMVIGNVMGISYGTITNAVRALAAITFMANGIYWLGNWITLLGMFVTPLLALVVTFGLFMTLFDLDPQETMTSIGALNILLFIANQLFLGVILIAIVASSGKKEKFQDDNQVVPGQMDPEPWPPDGGGKRGKRNPVPDEEGDDN